MSPCSPAAYSRIGMTELQDEGKIAAIGVHISRWVTSHGFALNVNTDLSYFDLIIACEGEPITSMKELLGHEVDMQRVENQIALHFAAVFQMELEEQELTIG